MKRSKFIKTLALMPFIGKSLKMEALNTLRNEKTESIPMPVLFLGHGSPMNAIEENEFVKGFRDVSGKIAKPTAILCISAHWETNGTFVTGMDHPKTIHDFGGFPESLYKVQYPAPGDPKLAGEVSDSVKKTRVGLDLNWGLDHGTWSVVKHLYPNADVPVLQLSLDYNKPASYHYELAKELSFLRKKGVLIIGSGNMVHNLGMVAWDKLNADNYGYDWALEANAKMRDFILGHNHLPLINYQSQGKAFELSIPTPEHYLPMLYTLALQTEKDKVELFNDKALGGSLSMTSVMIGQSA